MLSGCLKRCCCASAPAAKPMELRSGKSALRGELGLPEYWETSRLALVGQTRFKSGEAKNTDGLGCFLLTEHRGARRAIPPCGLLTTVAYKFGKQSAPYALEGSIAITGALVQWMG